jgi:hypothetical protein
MDVNFVVDYWLTIFDEALRENTDDELKLNVLKRSPLQDDPIREAPYLLMKEDYEKGIAPKDLGEIGGSFWWRAPFIIVAAPRSQQTQDRAHYLVNLLSYRLVYVIRKNALKIVEGPQGVLEMQNLTWHVITAVRRKVTGGEGEWQSRVEIEMVCDLREAGPFPYGTYPGDIEAAF